MSSSKPAWTFSILSLQCHPCMQHLSKGRLEYWNSKDSINKLPKPLDLLGERRSAFECKLRLYYITNNITTLRGQPPASASASRFRRMSRTEMRAVTKSRVKHARLWEWVVRLQGPLLHPWLLRPPGFQGMGLLNRPSALKPWIPETPSIHSAFVN